MATPSNSPRRLFAFLRAINVGGHNISMAELRRVFIGLRLKNVETFIASGNVIFQSEAKDIPALENDIEKRLLRALGYEVKVFVRTESELAAVARCEPFKGPQVATALALNVAFVSEPPALAVRKLIQALKTELDDFRSGAVRFIGWARRDRAIPNSTTRASKS